MAKKKLECNQCGGRMRVDSGGVTVIGGSGPAPIVKLRCDKCDITRFEQRADIEAEQAQAGAITLLLAGAVVVVVVLGGLFVWWWQS